MLSDFSFDIKEGERIAIVGDNGCGKTTLLKILSGLLKTKNSVLFKGQKIELFNKNELRRDICSIFTWPIEANFLDVKEYLGLVNESLYQEKLETKLIKEVLSKFKSEHIMNDYLHSLSDGQKQISKLARIAHHKGSLIILDEPTSFLDMNKKRLLADFLIKKKTIIFSSHDESFIKQVATRSIHIN